MLVLVTFYDAELIVGKFYLRKIVLRRVFRIPRGRFRGMIVGYGDL